MKPPAALGFRMPAEWEKQTGIWLAWPHHRNDWPGKFEPIPWVYAEIVRAIAASEELHILALPAVEDKAREVLERAGVSMERVHFHPVPTNRVWTRDSGPTFLTNSNGEKLLLDWKFTAWAKYPNHGRDNNVPKRIAEITGLPVRQPKYKGKRVVLEGGAIDVNGTGTLLTTEECLLSEVQCRNPGLTRADYEKIFADWLGATHTIWLGHGIAGDDTHGHVDDLARFTAEDTVVTVVEPNRQDANHAPLQDNLRRLKQARTAQGKPLDVAELPMPKPLYFEGTRLPASYANFLITNGAVLTPVFNDPNDRVALNTLAQLFPTREVVPIYAGDLVWGFGTIHCLSQQAV